MSINNIITFQQYSSKVSPMPPWLWSYDEQTYRTLSQMYPSAFNNKNQTWMLEVAIIDAFIGGRFELPLSKYYVLSMCGRGEGASIELIQRAWINLEGLFSLYNYSEALKEELSNSWSSEEIESIWNYDRDASYRFSDTHDLAGCRVALYNPFDDFELVKNNYLNCRYDTDTPRFWVLSGNLITPQSTKTIKKVADDFKIALQEYYQDKNVAQSLIEYVELVNELVNNKSRTKLIKDNAPIVLDWLVECRDNNSGICEDLNEDKGKTEMYYLQHKRSVEKLMDIPKVVYRIPKPSSARIFDGTDQSLAREVRSKIYPESCGCFDLDLCRSQLAIISSLSGCPELAKWLKVDNLWDEIRLDTGVPKWIAKPCLYTYCFGGNANTWYKEGYIDKEYAEELKAHPLFKSLLKAGKTLREQIEADGFIVLEKGFILELNSDFNSRQALATKIQYIESMIVKSVVEYISQQKGKMNLLGVYHDGVLIRVRPKTKDIRKHLATINEIAKEKGLSFGIKNISLDYK